MDDTPESQPEAGGASALQPGDAVVIRTPDRREYRGRFVEMRDDGRTAVVRLDSGWVTSYPIWMIQRDARAQTR